MIDLGLGEPDFGTLVHINDASAAGALNGLQDEEGKPCRKFEKHRDHVVEHVVEILGVTLDAPDDPFKGLFGCGGLIGATTPDGETLTHDADVPDYLPKAVGIAAAPRKIHDFSPFSRISIAVAEEVLRAAMYYIARVVCYPKGLTL